MHPHPISECCEYGCTSAAGPSFASEDALARLRAKLTGGYPLGVGKVTFKRTDGRTVVLDNVLYDQIGVDARQTALGVVTITTEDEESIHLPFVESWTVDF